MEVVIVGASRDAADDFSRRVHGPRHDLRLHRASLTQLAARLAAVEMARVGVAPPTALGAAAVAARVSFEAVRERTIILRVIGSSPTDAQPVFETIARSGLSAGRFVPCLSRR